MNISNSMQQIQAQQQAVPARNLKVSAGAKAQGSGEETPNNQGSNSIHDMAFEVSLSTEGLNLLALEGLKSEGKTIPKELDSEQETKILESVDLERKQDRINNYLTQLLDGSEEGEGSNSISKLANTYSAMLDKIKEEYGEDGEEYQKALEDLDKAYDWAASYSAMWQSWHAGNSLNGARISTGCADERFVQILDHFTPVIDSIAYREHLNYMAQKAKEFVQEFGRAATDEELDAYSGVVAGETFEQMTMAEIAYMEGKRSDDSNGLSENFQLHMEKVSAQYEAAGLIKIYYEGVMDEQKELLKETERLERRKEMILEHVAQRLELADPLDEETLEFHARYLEDLKNIDEALQGISDRLEELKNLSHEDMMADKEIAASIDNMKAVDGKIAALKNKNTETEEEAEETDGETTEEIA